MRLFFEVAYKGTDYHGWQAQKNGVTVQGTIEDCLSTILRKPVPIVGSGRTDAGVHCKQQYFHADLPDDIILEDLRYKVNSFLPNTIVIRSVKKVREEAHARFDAISRGYEYIIFTEKNPFKLDTALFHYKALDIETMNKASSLLLGRHDFESFSRVKTDVNTFFCTIEKAEWKKKDNTITFRIFADRFLRGMVRSIVGTLLDVGEHKISLDDFRAIIESRDRRNAGKSVAATGLFLISVEYPKEIFL
ncbi:MAG: tRNA pseudouridine(38-40) synthase TruA [Cyclobacteriaceae bacterium]|nr:tRNA pseudouridine(38-40) synthase TruA [Cyclobacteriaceae bacterium]